MDAYFLFFIYNTMNAFLMLLLAGKFVILGLYATVQILVAKCCLLFNGLLAIVLFVSL